jgi:hypothetical protein
MFVRPAENKEKPGTLLLVRYPYNRTPLPAAGADVPEDAYWLTLLRDGDVVLGSAPAADSAPPPAAE